MPKTITETIIGILANQSGLPAEEIRPESTLRGGLNLDSLEEIEVILEIEDGFNIAIADSTLETLSTVGDLISCVEGILAPDAAAAGDCPS